MNEIELQRIYNYSFYPKDSTNFSDKLFVNIDDGRMGGTQWTCFIIKDRNLITTIVSEDSQKNFSLNKNLNH